MTCTRRDFLSGLTMAGTVGLLGPRPERAWAEAPPETTKLRANRGLSICQAPQFVADALFAAEGFTDVQYVGDRAIPETALISGEAQIGMLFAGPLILRLDQGAPIVILAGGHVGCLEVFAHDSIRAIRDLKGKKIAVSAAGSPGHTFIATVMSHVGLDPRKDVTFVWLRLQDAVRAFEARAVDAFVAAPPIAQEFRARKIGRVLVNSSTDRPWSQYFCCLITAHQEFVQKHPVATKRALRAILKSADVCALEPERAARVLVDKAFTPRYDYALQAMKDLPYGKWRDYDPEDTIRFYALRLHETGMIASTPQTIIARGTDWRFLKELKKELKG